MRERVTVSSGIVRKKEKRSRAWQGACVIVIAGALFCSVYFSSALQSRYSERIKPQNYTFDSVYVMANGGDSVLTGSVKDGEWSFWSYLEYMMARLFGVEG